MLSLQPHPPPTLIFHGLYGGILQVSPVAYSYLVAKYQMSSGPYGTIFWTFPKGMSSVKQGIPGCLPIFAQKVWII